MQAVLVGLLFAADKMTKKVLADIADGISMVVTWIINLHLWNFGLVFNTVSTNGLDILQHRNCCASSADVAAGLFYFDQSASGLLGIRQNPYPPDFPIPEEKC